MYDIRLFKETESRHPGPRSLSLWLPHRDRRQLLPCPLLGEHPERLPIFFRLAQRARIERALALCNAFQPRLCHLPKLRFAIRFLLLPSPGAAHQARVMQKRAADYLLYSSIALLAFSILGFIYFLWETYRMAAAK
jgi:hypothetical protein